MIGETFLRDLRIGLRVLIKEKSFCVTTMFSVVNGVMLRGFSFPATRVDPMIALRAE